MMSTKCECGFPAYAQGHCARCYRRKRRRGELQKVRVMTPRTGPCIGPGCKRKVYARGCCGAHYVQLIRGKQLTTVKARGPYTMVCTETATAKVDARVEREIAAGTRCRCGLLIDKDHPSCDLPARLMLAAISQSGRARQKLEEMRL